VRDVARVSAQPRDVDRGPGLERFVSVPSSFTVTTHVPEPVTVAPLPPPVIVTTPVESIFIPASVPAENSTVAPPPT
jgi:hypothetical protein